MNFKELILDFCNTKSNPDKLLSDLLSIHPENDLSDSIYIILSETLYPGFQQQITNPENSNSISTSTNLPEATARGSRMCQIIMKINDKLNWEYILNKIINSFDPKMCKISINSLSQFLSSIQFKIDDFLLLLCKSSNIQLSTQIFVQLNSLDPNNGAIDLFDLNLKPILQTESNVRHILLYYKYIVMLEVKIVAISSFSTLDESLANIFSKDLHSAPEYMILACLHLLHELPSNLKENEVIFNMMQNIFIDLLDINSPYLSAIFALFDEFNPKEFGKLLLKYLELKKNQESIHKIASLTACFKNDTVIMSILSNCLDFDESFAIAIIFSQYGWKNFNNFIGRNLDTNPKVSSKVIIDYLTNQAKIEYASLQQGKKMNNSNINTNNNKSLRIETIYFLIDALSFDNLPTEYLDDFNNLQTICMQAYPRLINFGQGHDAAILMNSSTNSFSINVEKEMKLYYQKLYKKEIETKDVVHMLERLKNSDNPHDQDVFACMIHSLLDEYRFFPEYPVDALATTSVLFGNIVLFKLVEGPALAIVLRYIIQSIKEPTQSKMFKFAIQALYSFMKRLPEFPKFCTFLCEISSLKSQPELYDLCYKISTGQIKNPKDESNTKSKLPSTVLDEDVELLSNYYSISIPEKTYNIVNQQIPPVEISDRVLFMVNNVSDSNVDSRISEMKTLLKPSHYKWFARYLVIQRAKLELNNQDLYGSIVAKLESHDFYSYVLYVTIRQIVALLNKTYSLEAKSNGDLTSTEKTHLKNLGSWLGRISLSKDHPILRKDISFKYLLVEGYDNGTLEYITPFVCKVLDQCKLSSIFKYPNPWLLGILQVLKEIYEVANLKLTLKFEIEVLCKDLGISLNDIKAANLIKNHKKEEIENIHKNQKLIFNLAKMALNDKRGVPTIIPTPISTNSNYNNTVLQQQQQQAQQQQLSALQQIQQQRLLARTGGIQQSPVLSNVTPLAQQAALLNAQQQQRQQQLQQQQQQQLQTTQALENLTGNSIFVTHPQLKRVFQLSITKAIKDVLPILSQRTNSVCLVTTKVLVQKDFAFEVDDFKLRKAYINTIRYFTEHLTIASSTDLIRDTIKSNVHQYLQHMSSANSPLEQSLVDQIPIAINDNINIALNITQNAVVEKAVRELDEAMLPAIALRRQFKSTNPNQVFCDTQNASQHAMTLPEPLGIRPGGISKEQFSIYEDFGKAKQAVSSQPQLQSQQIDTANATTNVPSTITTPSMTNVNTNSVPTDVKQRLLQQQLFLQQQQQQQQQQSQPKLPGQLPPVLLEQTIAFINQHIDNLNKAIDSIENPDVRLSDNIAETEPVKAILVEISQAFSRINEPQIYMIFTQVCLNTLFGKANSSTLLVDSFIYILSFICDVSTVVVKFICSWLLTFDDERKYNVKVMMSFILEGFISINDLSSAISKKITSTNDMSTISFACALIKTLVFGTHPIALRSDFIQLISTLENLDDTAKENEQIVELFKLLATEEATFILKAKNLDTSDNKDYMGYVFAEWVKLFKYLNDFKYEVKFIEQLVDIGFINKPALFTNFFNTAIEMSVISFNKEIDNNKRSSIENFTAIDSLAKLTIDLLLVQDCSSENFENQVALFNKICSVFILTLSNDHELNKGNFNERPYFRFFSSFLCQLSDLKQNNFKPFASNEKETESFNKLYVKIYEKISDVLLCLQPSAFPGFTYSWISLISHRMFMPMMIEFDGEGKTICGEKICSLFVSLLRFESKFIKDKQIPDSINVIYKGTLRIFTMLLHDFPEFLSKWFNPLVSAISLRSIQLRNIILSAVPFNLIVPDPFQQGLKVDRLPETKISPIISSDPSQLLLKNHIKKAVDSYLKQPSNSLLRQILLALELSEHNKKLNDEKYDIELINSLVLYTCISYVEDRPKNSLTFNTKSSQVSLLTSLMQEGDIELQFLILQAIANNLRYPNSHTYWFSCIILNFFGSKALWGDKKIDIQQLITRVLLERIVCCKPHPWGLLVTFIELLKNKEYEFSSLPFVKISPEIESILTTLIAHARGTTSTSATSANNILQGVSSSIALTAEGN